MDAPAAFPVPAGATLRRIPRAALADTAWALLGFVAPTLLQLLYVVVAARLLAVDEFGLLMLCAGVAAIVMTLSAAGAGGVATKAIARDPGAAPMFLGQALSLTLWTAPLAVPLAVGIATAVGTVHMPLTLAVCVSLADVVFWRIATTCQQVFIGLGQQFRSAMLGTLVPFGRLASAALAVFAPPGSRLDWFALAYLVSSAVTAALALAYAARRTGRPMLAVRRFPARFHWGEGAGFALLWLNAAVQVECDKLILSCFTGPADVGIYALASRLMDGAFAPPRALKASVQARLFREGATGHSAVFRFSCRLVPIVAAYGLLAWAAIVALTPLAVALFGQRYAALATILPAVAALPLLRSLADIGGEVFIASDQVGRSTAVQVLGTAVRVALGVLFIRALGLRGAPLAALAATALAAAVFWLASWHALRQAPTRSAHP